MKTIGELIKYIFYGSDTKILCCVYINDDETGL